MGAGIAPGSPVLRTGDFFHPTPQVLYVYHTLSGRWLFTTAANLAVVITRAAPASVAAPAGVHGIAVRTFNPGHVAPFSRRALIKASRGWPIAMIYYFEYLSIR